jgi:hypothetical protein
MRDKLIQMLPLLRDKNGISDCETQIREYQKYVEYFTEELNKLKSKSSPPRPPPTTDIHPRSNPPPPTPAHKKKKYTNLGML